MSNLLLPDRHPVKDFFVLEAMEVLPRDEMASMEHPIFSLSTKPDVRSLKYQHGENSIEIIPSMLGLPTVFDKDLLIYTISKLMHMRDRGESIGPTVRITTRDLLVNTNRPTNDLGYKRLAPALDRLKGVTVKTNIKSGGGFVTKGFGLIEEFEYNRKGSMFEKRLEYLELTLSKWMFQAVEAADVLPISKKYFRLRRPIDRRLYELARKHCGQQDSWRVGLDVLQKKSGSGSPAKLFKHYVCETIRENHLPGYAMTLEGSQVVFWKREDTRSALSSQGAPASEPPAPSISGIRAGAKPSSDGKKYISPEGLEAARPFAPCWDMGYLENKYYEWREGKPTATNVDAAFIGWVKSVTKCMPPQ